MLRGFISRLSLLAKFTLVSFLVTLLVAIGLAVWLETRLEKDALWAVAENATNQVETTLETELGASDFGEPLTGERYNQVDRLIHLTLMSSDIVRIKIWNPEGLLIYSNDPGLVGGIFPIGENLQAALNGQMQTDISNLEAEENIAERGDYTRLFEVYVPIRESGGSHVIGAYEVYYDFNQLQPRLARIRNAVWGGVGLGFLILYGSLFFLIRTPSRELIQRNEENQRLLVAEREQRRLAETLQRVSLALSGVLDLRKLLDLICRESTLVFGTQAAYLWLLEGEELVGFAAHGQGADQFIGMRYALYDPVLLGARIARERKPFFINDSPHSSQVDQKLISYFGIQSILGAPLLKGDRVLGSLMIIDTIDPQRFQSSDLEKASVFSSHAAVAIDNAQLFDQAARHLQHEKALREIDLAITSSVDLETSLGVVLDQVKTQLKVDAAAIMLLGHPDHILEYGRGYGFNSGLIRTTSFGFEQGIVGKSLLERRLFGEAEIRDSIQIPERTSILEAEGFKAYFTAPLIAKDNILGALEVYHREPLTIATDWLNFLEALAGQAAIAIDNANLFASLQRSNAELSTAYEQAIEGWSAALDLRDRETEGHTQRVTDLTLKLASRMGFDSAGLIHIRRGSLLHDIGKMGVPDRILLKADELTESEWVDMRKHPSYAYDLLKSVSYLAPALDIPHYHHEKWDGSGYPHGLKGDEIPLTARIFAVVDVFDALSSNRPYRDKWTHQKVLDHIRSLAGSHFDPQVVDAFLGMLIEN